MTNLDVMLLVVVIVVQVGSLTLALLAGWMLAGALGPLGLKDEGPAGGRRTSARMAVAGIVPLAQLGLWIWTWRATPMGSLGAMFGSAAMAATLFSIVYPLWSLKNLLFGPRRMAGAVGLAITIVLSLPLLNAYAELREFLPAYWSALQGRMSLVEFILKVWSTALGLGDWIPVR